MRLLSKKSGFRILNSILRSLNISIVPDWKLQWWTSKRSFSLWEKEYLYFYHNYNCGWPPFATERVVELALADAWLSKSDFDEIVEIGAVTPYYWPKRLKTIIDPYDSHNAVTHRISVFDVNLVSKVVLSISTIEHIGMGDYGLPTKVDAAPKALKKILDEAASFLVTFPLGYNPVLDEFIESSRLYFKDVDFIFLVSDDEGEWHQEVDFARAWRQVGVRDLKKRFPNVCVGNRANSVAILERGGLLSGK